MRTACYTEEATAAGGNCDRGLLPDVLFIDDGAIFLSSSFSEHGPKDKRKGKLWRLRELHRGHWHDLGEHLPAILSFPFKALQQGCGWLDDTTTPSFSSWPASCM